MPGKNWVLLVAGSTGWDNYRHQANVCCAYQIIKGHGIPDEQIVVMMYDDIAYNSSNPYQGNIQSVVAPFNVYTSVPHDYTGEMVTAKNFLCALQGDDSTGKKIIRSRENDNIFVYMSGVGDEGKFNFPDKALSAADLISAINNMHDRKKYSKTNVTFSITTMDSDKSESMFKHLSESKDVYAGTSCDTKSVNKPFQFDDTRNTYLSDEFSAAWFKYISMADFKSTTIGMTFDYIKAHVHSHPCEKGDTMGFRNLKISEFLDQKMTRSI